MYGIRIRICIGRPKCQGTPCAKRRLPFSFKYKSRRNFEENGRTCERGIHNKISGLTTPKSDVYQKVH